MAQVLTPSEAEGIARTIELLRGLDGRLNRATEDEWATGRLAEAVDMAGDMLFNVLNTAANVASCEHARQAIDQGRERYRATREKGSVPAFTIGCQHSRGVRLVGPDGDAA